jgi:electron transfer flavoprotein beta subunit
VIPCGSSALPDDPQPIAMRVCVCLRQVPDPQARLELLLEEAGEAGAGGRQAREPVPWVTGESDDCALEEALRLARLAGGEVSALTVGPARAVETLRRALALGASDALHVLGDAPLDPRRLGALLAAAIRRQGCELVLTGAQSSDLGWGLTGTSLAAELGWPHVWLAIGVELERDARDGELRLLVTRELERRRRERSRLTLPAVLCVQSGIHRPRMPRIRDLLEAKKREIEVLRVGELLAQLGVVQDDAADGGGAGPAVELVGFSRPAGAGAGELMVGPPAAAARELVRRLRSDGLLAEAG